MTEDAQEKCKNCDSPTSTGWDGKPLALCEKCAKAVRYHEAEEEKALRRRKFSDPKEGEVKNTFKFTTVALLIAGVLAVFLFGGFGILVLLGCWSYAYISYQRGEPKQEKVPYKDRSSP